MWTFFFKSFLFREEAWSGKTALQWSTVTHSSTLPITGGVTLDQTLNCSDVMKRIGSVLFRCLEEHQKLFYGSSELSALNLSIERKIRVMRRISACGWLFDLVISCTHRCHYQPMSNSGNQIYFAASKNQKVDTIYRTVYIYVYIFLQDVRHQAKDRDHWNICSELYDWPSLLSWVSRLWLQA